MDAPLRRNSCNDLTTSRQIYLKCKQISPQCETPKRFCSIHIKIDVREINKEGSCRSNCGAGFLGGIWEAFGSHLGRIWEPLAERYLDARKLCEASWRYLVHLEIPGRLLGTPLSLQGSRGVLEQKCVKTT
jgi:hypothetical protein